MLEYFLLKLNILKKAIPKLWRETLITQDSIKTQVIPKKYVKIEKNQIQNLQIKNRGVLFTIKVKIFVIFFFFTYQTVTIIYYSPLF
jgi:hypothetical protein